MCEHLGVICHDSDGLRRYVYCKDFLKEIELAARTMPRNCTKVGQWVEFKTNEKKAVIAIRPRHMVYPTLPVKGEGIAVVCQLRHYFISGNREEDIYEVDAIGKVYDPKMRVCDSCRFGSLPFTATIIYKRQAGRSIWEVDFVQL